MSGIWIDDDTKMSTGNVFLDFLAELENPDILDPNNIEEVKRVMQERVDGIVTSIINILEIPELCPELAKELNDREITYGKYKRTLFMIQKRINESYKKKLFSLSKKA